MWSLRETCVVRQEIHQHHSAISEGREDIVLLPCDVTYVVFQMSTVILHARSLCHVLLPAKGTENIVIKQNALYSIYVAYIVLLIYKTKTIQTIILNLNCMY